MVLLGGTAYYVIVDGYAGDHGDYVLAVTERFPYEAECLYGVLQYEEGEPPLEDGYGDDHNGGCNSPEFGNPMQQLPVVTGSGACFHGRSGWYSASDGSASRDTDWFTIDVLPGLGFQLGLDADWPCHFFVLGPQDCGQVDVIEFWTFGGNEYGAVEIFYPADPGQLWVWVGPTTLSPPEGADDEFDYCLATWGDLPVELHSWSAVKGLFD